METLTDYRHVVDKKIKKQFISSLKNLAKTSNMKNIGFIGVIGSHNEEYSHDIDVIMFPSKKAKLGEFIISTIDVYNTLEKNLKENNERLFVCCSPKKVLQEMTYYLASLQEGTSGLIPVHSLIYTDLKSFKKFNPVNFQKEIKKTLIPLYGKFEIINSLRNDIPQEKLEPYFLILDFEMNSKLKSFPRNLVRANAESLFSYLNSKYGLKINVNKIHHLDDIQKAIYDTLHYLDQRLE